MYRCRLGVFFRQWGQDRRDVYGIRGLADVAVSVCDRYFSHFPFLNNLRGYIKRNNYFRRMLFCLLPAG